MKEIPNIDSFPFQIRQRHRWSCIPASIEAVTKYFQHESPVTEEYLWHQYESACRNRSIRPQDINFKTIKELVLDVDSNYSWGEVQYIGGSELHDFVDLIRHIRHSIDNGLPHIVSLPIGKDVFGRTLWHMFPVLGYDDLNLRIHDPDPSKESPRDLSLKKILLDLQTLVNTSVTDSLVIKPK